MTEHFDAIVIGTGQAGPSLAVRLAGAGRKTAILERKRFGGTCVNVGCIPTKTLIASARAAHVARNAAEFGVAINELVKRGEIKAPIVIGRDHLDAGSVASPNRETEGMIDGSDAIADWPLLNALVNTAAGASWISIHNGGGVGIGYSQHAGMVVVADGSENSKGRLERVLTSDPGMGVLRHADAGYSRAIDFAKARKVGIPMEPRARDR